MSSFRRGICPSLLIDAPARNGYIHSMKRIWFWTTLLALLALPPSAFAQTPTECKTTYIVQAGDWLSKIAGWYYGDVHQYAKIMDATNASPSDQYNRINDPNRVEVGWKLCLESAAQPGNTVAVDYDFRNGAQGWEAGFADYPPGQEDFFQLKSGIQDMADVAPTFPAYFISGSNHSDDLFMFLKKKLTAKDGIQPNTTYQLKFTLVFASNAPSGCFGVGGAPGEGVTLKAGGSTIEPKPLDDNGTYRMNVDKGNQAQGGPAGDVVSDIANGLSCDNGPSGVPYVSLTKTHVSQYPIKSDPDGNLWLMVGTDSGFEAITALYYQNIQVELSAK